MTDCVRGEYRDRLIVTNPDLRLYTRALGIFQELQARIEATAPKFKDPVFVQGLARQMEQLRGRELPGFMSAQSFYMFIQEYIDKWKDPALVAVSQMRVLALEVATKLVEAIALSYPVLRDAYRGVASRILEAAEMTCTEAVEGVLGREKDPFTVNDFLQAHINKLRHDRFAAAVNGAFSKCKSSHDSWQAAKEEVAASMRSWYRTTHGVNSSANAEDMSAILEAYVWYPRWVSHPLPLPSPTFFFFIVFAHLVSFMRLSLSLIPCVSLLQVLAPRGQALHRQRVHDLR